MRGHQEVSINLAVEDLSHICPGSYAATLIIPVIQYNTSLCYKNSFSVIPASQTHPESFLKQRKTPDRSSTSEDTSQK